MLVEAIGLPDLVAVDRGLQPVSQALDGWAHRTPGSPEVGEFAKPDQTYVVLFTANFLEKCLDHRCPEILTAAQEEVEVPGLASTRSGLIERYTSNPYCRLGRLEAL